MLLLCWNVAALGTTLPKVREHNNKSLAEYLDKHGADIVCLQARHAAAPTVARADVARACRRQS